MTELNLHNINRLIAFIDTERNHFDMAYWFDTWDGKRKLASDKRKFASVKVPCGTVMCIGGACNYLENAVDGTIMWKCDPVGAAKWLGISKRTACHLFHMATIGFTTTHGWVPGREYGELSKVTADDAIHMLKALKRTGKVSKKTWATYAPHAILDPQSERWRRHLHHSTLLTY